MMLKQGLRAVALAFVVALFASGTASAQNLSGSVTGTGKVTVGDTAIQGSASVGNGSIIATAADGDAQIDLGALGKIDLRPNTTIQLTTASGGLQITMTLCGSITQTLPAGVSSKLIVSPPKQVLFAVVRGNVSLDQEHRGSKNFSSGMQTLLHKVNGVSVSSSSGETVFTITCNQGNFFDTIIK